MIELHRPVLLTEVIGLLEPKASGIYLDGTFGAGGYSRGLLDSAGCRVFALDRDPSVLPGAKKLETAYPGRLTFLLGRFSEMERLLGAAGVVAVDGVALDIGVSSMQLDQAERGFSFRDDGPLDMRMGQTGLSAADLINDADEGLLADVIFRYGEERQSRRIAKAIVAARARQPILRTGQLADIVASVVRGAPGRHPATKTFQALRIHVNDELGELSRGLSAAERLLKPGGRLAVVTFHSLEDRIVKRFLALRSGAEAQPSRHLPGAAAVVQRPSFTLLARGGITASDAEVACNARARSARLRGACRTEHPAFPEQAAA